MERKPVIALIVAMADNGVIGRSGTLPWHLPDDLKRFKQLTMGKPIVMGRKTFESIGKPLPGRHNIVVSRRREFRAAGVTVVGSLDAAIAVAQNEPEIMVIGGAELYAQALALATRIYLTRVHGQIDGEVRFPPLDAAQWQSASRYVQSRDERHAYDMSFELLQRFPTH